jgi:hypothetical protein
MKLLAALALSSSVVLTGCTARQMDEGVIRRHFVIPQTARALVVEATPAESGWFLFPQADGNHSRFLKRS